MTSELINILNRTVSGNAGDQQETLTFLQRAAETNAAEFIRQLSIVLSAGDEASSPVIRQAAGLQLKNLLVAKEASTSAAYAKRWLDTPAEVRNEVKVNCLQTLGTEQSRPSQAAQCISAIVGIEFPVGQWTDVVDILTNFVVSQAGSSPKKMEAALEALGYICQDVANMESKSDLFLTAIVFALRSGPNPEVKVAAIEALLNCLELTSKNFANPAERNVIMEVVCEGTQSKIIRIRVVALQCLVKIVSSYYNYMDAYMQAALFSITLDAMRSTENDVVLQGIEFWSNICEEELNLAEQARDAQEIGKAPEVVSRYYARGALPHILPILLETLAKQDEHDDEDDWVPAKSSGVCIMLLAQCTENEIVPLVLPFIQEHFTNPNWHFRDAAIMAFGSILDGPSAGVLEGLVQQAIEPLILCLSDQQLSVRDTAAWALGRVCDTSETLVTQSAVLEKLVPALIDALKQEPRVAYNTCWAISSLVKAAYQIAKEHGTDESGEPETYALTPVFIELIKRLIEVTDRSDANEHNLRISGYEALMELIKNSPKDCYAYVQQTTLDVLNRLQTLLDMEQNALSSQDRSQLHDLESLLCATLQSVLRKMRPEDAPVISDHVMASLICIMSKSNDRDAGAVMEDALLAVTVLIEVMGVQFAKYVDQFKPFLVNALRNTEHYEVCEVAIGVISDMCHAFQDKIAPIMDEFVELLLFILQNPDVKHRVKSVALGCFSDIAIALGPGFDRYLEITVSYLMNAINAAQISNPDDYEQIEYVTALRESCVNSFTGIIQAMRNSQEGLEKLKPFITQVVRLIVIISDNLSLSTDELLSSTCGLVGDLVTTYQMDILPLVNIESINALLQYCRRSKSQKARSIGTWASRELNHIKRSATAVN